MQPEPRNANSPDGAQAVKTHFMLTRGMKNQHKSKGVLIIYTIHMFRLQITFTYHQTHKTNTKEKHYLHEYFRKYKSFKASCAYKQLTLPGQSTP